MNPIAPLLKLFLFERLGPTKKELCTKLYCNLLSDS